MNNAHQLVIKILESFPERSSITIEQKDWDEVQKICSRNKLLCVMYKILKDARFEDFYRKSTISSFLSEHEIEKIFNQFNNNGVKAILIRGLYLGFMIYKDPVLRPFTDIDILIKKHNIGKVKEPLGKLGYYNKPHLLTEELFLDAHLHVIYFNTKKGIPCEIHWAIDHPFSHYTIKMDEVFKTVTPVDIGRIHCFDMKPEMRLILLMMHVQKHLPYLKYNYNDSDLLEQVAADGELLHIFDVYLFLKTHADDLEWPLFIKKAEDWNVGGVMYSVLKTVNCIFKHSVPDDIFDKLSSPVNRPFEKFLAKNNETILTVTGSKKLMSRMGGQLFFGKDRLTDLYSYFFPDKRTIKRKYNVNWVVGILLYYIVNFITCSSKIMSLFIKYLQLRKKPLPKNKKSVKRKLNSDRPGQRKRRRIPN